MTCYHPIPAYQAGPGLPLKLWPRFADCPQNLPARTNLAVPCGQCIGCLSTRSLQWAHRCGHEATLYQDNTFVHLTYDDDHLPAQAYLRAKDLQLFIKRLRKNAHRVRRSTDGPGHGARIRYFASGEYGDQYGRPHYHAILFNCGFGDRYKVGHKNGHDIFQSETLTEIWGLGAAKFGDATPAAANYIAQYTLKKQEWRLGDQHGRPPPFARMSLKPAIGTAWLEQYQEDLRHGYLLEQSYKQPIPRTYKNKIKKHNPTLYQEIQQNTEKNNAQPTDKHHLDRLHDQETIHHRNKHAAETR